MGTATASPAASEWYWDREPHPHAGKQQPLICETCAEEQVRALEAERDALKATLQDFGRARDSEIAKRDALWTARAEKAEARVAGLEKKIREHAASKGHWDEAFVGSPFRFALHEFAEASAIKGERRGAEKDRPIDPWNHYNPDFIRDRLRGEFTEWSISEKGTSAEDDELYDIACLAASVWMTNRVKKEAPR